jgi:cytochrome c biogenesis protein CcdA
MQDHDQVVNETAQKVPLKTAFTNFTESAEGVIDTYYKLGVATATEKAADVAAYGATRIVLVFFLGFTLLFGFIGAAFWIGSLLNSTAAGFGIVAGFFALLTLMVIALKNKVIYPMVQNTIVKKVYEARNNANNHNVRGVATRETAPTAEAGAPES